MQMQAGLPAQPPEIRPHRCRYKYRSVRWVVELKALQLRGEGRQQRDQLRGAPLPINVVERVALPHMAGNEPDAVSQPQSVDCTKNWN